mmetsp:Transcript_123980/g.355892  ORF Transcript_123980/g.355892 Transcript_123980/m.355892 type:complete len:210 (+) Transcript_123980:1355-1984(+)
MVATSTASSPARPVFVSMAVVAARISFFFATTRLSWFATAASSAVVISASSLSISSAICLRIPTISLERESDSESSALAEPADKNEASTSRSALLISNDSDNFLSIPTAVVCKKPLEPFSSDAMACLIALMLALVFAESFSKASFSCFRSEFALSKASSAASRSLWCAFTSSVNCRCFCLVSSKVAWSCGILSTAEAIEALSPSSLFRQ